jgi:two-component system response regulator YesN
MKTLLIVDDEFMVRKAIKELICWKEYGFDPILEAYDVHSAIQKLKDFSIDLMLTDIKMPDGTGIDLLNRIQKESISVGSIYIITAYDDFDYARQSFRFGIRDFIVKTEINAAILSQIAKRENSPELLEQAANAKVRKVIHYIEEHLGESISLQTAADYVKITAPHLSKIFVAETGVTFNHYITERRIREACRLLRESEEYIYTIAEQVGYSNFNYFNKIFKNVMGITPNEYRNQLDQT